MVVQWWMNGELVLRWPNELCTTISLLSAFYFKPPFICFQPPADLSWTPLVALGLAWRVDLFVRRIRLCSYEIIPTLSIFPLYWEAGGSAGQQERWGSQVRKKKKKACAASVTGKKCERDRLNPHQQAVRLRLSRPPGQGVVAPQ